MGPWAVGVSGATAAPEGAPRAAGEVVDVTAGIRAEAWNPCVSMTKPSPGGGQGAGPGWDTARGHCPDHCRVLGHCPDQRRVLGSLSRPAQGPGVIVQTGAGSWRGRCPDQRRVLGGSLSRLAQGPGGSLSRPVQGPGGSLSRPVQGHGCMLLPI